MRKYIMAPSKTRNMRLEAPSTESHVLWLTGHGRMGHPPREGEPRPAAPAAHPNLGTPPMPALGRGVRCVGTAVPIPGFTPKAAPCARGPVAKLERLAPLPRGPAGRACRRVRHGLRATNVGDRGGLAWGCVSDRRAAEVS